MDGWNTRASSHHCNCFPVSPVWAATSRAEYDDFSFMSAPRGMIPSTGHRNVRAVTPPRASRERRRPRFPDEAAQADARFDAGTGGRGRPRDPTRGGWSQRVVAEPAAHCRSNPANAVRTVLARFRGVWTVPARQNRASRDRPGTGPWRLDRVDGDDLLRALSASLRLTKEGTPRLWPWPPRCLLR